MASICNNACSKGSAILDTNGILSEKLSSIVDFEITVLLCFLLCSAKRLLSMQQSVYVLMSDSAAFMHLISKQYKPRDISK
mmetsp:Transcript_11706/g.21777  ORF Transcript_11706/g.21777 Transcript_11706/m.21777 type:complete len:81 (-) Transcript_11706:36-278(-)